MRWCWVLLIASCGRFGFDARESPDAAPPDAQVLGLHGPGKWTAMPTAPLAARVWTSGLWTGSEFVVFGGALDTAYNATDTGARFDPVRGTWGAMSTTPSPGPRHTARMAMVGGKLVEYGGGSGFDGVAGGGRFDLATDQWTVMSASPPGPRIYASVAGTDSLLFTFGGWSSASDHLATAFVYEPILDTWTQTSPAPLAPRSFSTAIWTGSEVIVWGGCSGGLPSCGTVFGDGAAYNPATDTWRVLSADGAPVARSQHAAVWTGSEMIVWGGTGGADEGMQQNTGAIYNPATDTWRTMSTDGAPSPRVDPGAAWLVDKLIVWGDDTGKDDGYLYDPTTDSWSAIAIPDAPELRARFAVAASQDPPRLFVWGGSFSSPSGSVWTPEP